MYHIFFNSSQEYIPYVCVCITSIINKLDKNISYRDAARDVLYKAENNKTYEERFCFHIITDQIPLELKDKVNDAEEALKKIYPVSIEIHSIDPSVFWDFPRWRKNFVTYYRLYYAQFVPQEVKRILFLDADTLVNTDIRPFMLQDLENKALAAVANYPRFDHTVHGKTPQEAYSYSSHKHYFNAGVMLIDVEYWQKNNLHGQCMQFLHTYHVLCPDQDALNAVYKDNVKILPYSWNLMWHNLTDPEKIKKHWKEHPDAFADDTFYENLDKPNIIHFSVKPWNSDGFRISTDCTPFYYPNMSLWWDMAEKTPVFGKEILAVKESEQYKKMLQKNKRQELLLQYSWYRLLLKLKRDTRPFMRKLEQPFKKIRDKWLKYKRTHAK